MSREYSSTTFVRAAIVATALSSAPTGAFGAAGLSTFTVSSPVSPWQPISQPKVLEPVTKPITEGKTTFEPLIKLYDPGSITEATITARRREVTTGWLDRPGLDPEQSFDPALDDWRALEESLKESIDVYLERRVRDHVDALCRARAAYALAAYYAGEHLAVADDYVTWMGTLDFTVPEVAEAGGIPADQLAVPCYFVLSTVWRLYLDPTIRSRMSPAARDTLKAIMWDYVDERSQIFVPLEENGWRIHGSENHDVIQKAAVFLGVQALRYSGDPSYGPDRALADGSTLEEHYLAWNEYFKAYFRERAREGLLIEVGSGYEKYTLANYYNIRDFAHSEILRTVAERFLTLFWADTAQEYIEATGVRGGAQIRIYKGAAITDGIQSANRIMYYVYGWLPEPHPASDVLLGPIWSSYRVPSIVNAIALGNKPPYAYAMRKPGLGKTIEGGYDVAFSPGDSSWIRRFSYITPEYVLGTMTFRPWFPYTLLVEQNRTMGVMFASDLDARIMLLGLGADDSYDESSLGGTTTGWLEINGAGAANALLVVRDPEARASDGSRIYMSYAGDVWQNCDARAIWKEGRPAIEDDWIFTWSGDAYVGIRIASGGYVVHTVGTKGKMLDLVDMWSPVVIQLGRAADYASFEAFKTSVRGNSFSYAWSGDFHYVTENGDVLEIHGDQPMTNGDPGLSPAKTYDSPYLLGWHGNSTVTLSFPGYQSLTLDFDYQGW